MNAWDIIIIVIVIILVIIAIINIRRSKGKCISCGLADNCPFKK